MKTIELYKAQIFLSNRCNLACAYCYFKEQKQVSQKLNFNQIKDFIIWFINFPGEYKEVELIGGEPLLEFELAKRTIEFLRHDPVVSPRKVFISDITTNGTIITNEIICFLKKENLKLNFSLDGDLKSNLNRKFKDNTDSFSVVWKNIFFYKENYTEPTIFMTISPNNAKGFYKNIRFLIDSGFQNISIAPEMLSTQWPKDTINVFLKEYRKFLKYYLLLKKPAGISIPFSKQPKMDDRITSFFCPDHLGDQAVLHFDGNIYGCPLAPCFKDQFKQFCFLGENPRTIDCKKFQPMRDYNLLKELGLKTNYKHTFINQLARMMCLCFNKDGNLIPIDDLKNFINLILQMHQEARNIGI
ncbi:MAG: hypothetical protein A2Y03_09535 [Omnitrophica WOR_2 bacterium GWF2_38_59]|nr:MAG: hypothetical protein A2Y03_09535 [Omnitrophica WOR_2 bacterium GWF2_38_59]OGX49600.1 MAG: hypothetical protein A2243_11740 [Omnitrophica WOR_2 bacterium RIFOXYA2_FULL_38_17]OGX52646.1 MAG: hypothetical protein A2267_10490 [Omnitrophica WOR_2 bacterium RIFOXYA12_FULL_38_10]OGX58882.1 MAG: hypothetical protein A2306_10840 [Omnitrophica WOR_2 bacterium RIFOXYB2_FULL_38_16]OGX59455.1 MAG: hypothetical protein A2447_06200 [Omnitrophica WOR_2 bacterium RIFOXYC2_FULL_38_12]HBG61638.1 hypothet